MLISLSLVFFQGPGTLLRESREMDRCGAKPSVASESSDHVSAHMTVTRTVLRGYTNSNNLEAVACIP